LKGGVTYDPYPREVCDEDFSLVADPFFEKLKAGDHFGVIFGAIFSPARFYITRTSKREQLESMMTDLE